MTPAERVIQKCGGPEKVAEVLGIHVTNVHRFKYSKDKGGRGGLVPAEHGQALLDWARANNVDLTPEDFFEGEGVEAAQ